MIKSTTYYDIVKLLRTEIINQTGLDPYNVINAVTARGPDLLKFIDSKETYSFNLNDSFIVFELSEIVNSDNLYTSDYNNESNSYELNSYINYSFKLMIYGNYSHDLGQKLLLQFRSADVSLKMRNEGIFIKGVTFPTSNNEFINNTYWPRVDMNINIQTRFTTKSLEETIIGGKEPIDENYEYINADGFIIRDFEKANKNRNK